MPSWNFFKKRVDRLEGLEECKPAPILDDCWKYEELTPGKKDIVKSRSHPQPHRNNQKGVISAKSDLRRSTKSRVTGEVKHSQSQSKRMIDSSRRRATKKHEEDISRWLQESFITYMPECEYDSRPSGRKERRRSATRSKSIATPAKAKLSSSRHISEHDGLIRTARNQMASLLYTTRNRVILTETIERSIRMRSSEISTENPSWMTDPYATDATRQADRRLAATYQARRLESEIQIDREIFLQDYIRENGISTSLYHSRHIKGRNSVTAMPINCSSPVRCCTRFHSTFSSQEIQIYREAQSMLLSHSFIGKHLSSIYTTMDNAMSIRRSKSIKLAAWKKKRNGNGDGSLSVKDWLEIDRPLVDRLDKLNEQLKKTSIPLRVVFRKTQETELDFDYDFWFVFPNTLDEIRGGFRYWEGVEHITTLDDHYSTNRGRY